MIIGITTSPMAVALRGGGSGAAAPAKPTITAPSASADLIDGASPTFTVTGDTYDSVEFFVGGTSIGTVSGNSGTIAIDVAGNSLLYAESQSLTAVGTVGAQTSPTSDAVLVTLAPPGKGTSLGLWLYPGNWDETAGEISQWHEASGNARHATQGTGSQQPTDTTDAGIRCAQFIAANLDTLEADGAAAILSGTDQPYTVIMLFRVPDTDGGTIWSAGNSGGTSPNIRCQTPRVAPANGTYTIFSADDGGTSVHALSTTATTGTVWRVFSAVNSGTAWTWYVDGDPTPIALTNGDISSLGAITANLFTLGAGRHGGGTNQYSDVFLSEFLMWNVALSTAAREAVEDEMLVRKAA